MVFLSMTQYVMSSRQAYLEWRCALPQFRPAPLCPPNCSRLVSHFKPLFSNLVSFSGVLQPFQPLFSNLVSFSVLQPFSATLQQFSSLANFQQFSVFFWCSLAILATFNFYKWMCHRNQLFFPALFNFLLKHCSKLYKTYIRPHFECCI